MFTWEIQIGKDFIFYIVLFSRKPLITKNIINKKNMKALFQSFKHWKQKPTIFVSFKIDKVHLSRCQVQM